MDKDSELFKNITFSDLMSDVYHNSKKMSYKAKFQPIEGLIDDHWQLILES